MSRVPKTITVTVPGAATGALDEQGNPVLGSPDVTEIVVKAFAPRESSDSPENGPRTISGGTVFGYLGDEIPSNALLTIDGVAYELDGEVGDWTAAYTGAIETGATGIEFAVKRAS